MQRFREGNQICSRRYAKEIMGFLQQLDLTLPDKLRRIKMDQKPSSEGVSRSPDSDNFGLSHVISTRRWRHIHLLCLHPWCQWESRTISPKKKLTTLKVDFPPKLVRFHAVGIGRWTFLSASIGSQTKGITCWTTLCLLLSFLVSHMSEILYMLH